MLTVAIRVAIGLFAVYLAALLVLYLMQSRFIYPAPQDVIAPAPGFEAVRVDTADGLALTAHWQPPEADQPSVVFFHGNGGTLAGSTAATQLLWTQGYVVLLVEYRGYGGNPGAPSEEGLYKDGRAAMAFLAGKGVAPERTIIIGNSIGSGPATQMALEFDPAALILVSPFASLVDVASDALPVFPVRHLLRDRYANVEKVPGLNMPILIQHGTADQVVPFAQGQKLAKAQGAATLQSFKGAGHQLAFQTDAQIAQSEWLDGLGL